MKKTLCLLLSVLAVFSLLACSAEETPEGTEPEKKDYSAYAGIVADPTTWYNELMALPIASADMTEDELRQLCVDAMKANLTVPWTPTEDISYSFTLLDKTSEVFLPKGIAYSGLCYCNNAAIGNVWKILNYYDKETGALDIAAMGGEFLDVITSACAKGVEWGWSRVCNSHGLETMASYSQYASNIVPVGSYTYAPGQHSFLDGSGTLDIIAENGNDVICESYAVMKVADGLYSSSSYHVMMCSAAPEVVYLSDGRINAEQSYLLVCEQDAIGTKTESKNYQQSNGVTMRPLGTVDKKYTFQELLDKGYIPFTLKELIGEDPVEAGDAWVGNQQKRIENGQDITLTELRTNSLCTNYAICTIEVQVQDPSGQVLSSYDPGLQTRPITYSAQLSSILPSERVEPYADGSNTIHIYVRLANGERKEALSTVLKLA